MENINLNKDEQDEQELTISLFDIWKILLRYKFIILAVTLAGVACSVLFTVFLTKTTFTSSFTAYVANQMAEATKQETVRNDDLQAARSFTDTCLQMIKLDGFAQSVSKDLGGKYTTEQIKKCISASKLEKTELLRVDISTEDPDESYEIARSVEKIFPDYILGVVKKGDVAIADSCAFPSAPDDKGLLKKVLIGFACGLVVGIAIAIIRGTIGDKITSPEDLEKRYKVTVLGVIPKLDQNNNERRR